MECLVTRLRGSVNDDSLLKLNELRFAIQVNQSASMRIRLGTASGFEQTVTVLDGPGGISLNQNDGYKNSISWNADDAGNRTLIWFQKSGEYKLSIGNKHALTEFFLYNSDGVDISMVNVMLSELNLDDLEWCENLYKFSAKTAEDGPDLGNIEKVFSHIDSKKHPLAFTLYTNGDYKIHGDFSKFMDRKNFDIIQLQQSNSTELKGCIKSLPNKIIQILGTYRPGLEVNLDDSYEAPSTLEVCTFNFPVTNVNFSSFKNCNKLRGIFFNDTASVTPNPVGYCRGDLASINSDAPLSTIQLKHMEKSDDVAFTVNKFPRSVYGISTLLLSNISRTIPLQWTDAGNNLSNIMAIESGHFKSGTADFVKAMSELDLNPSVTINVWKKIQIVLCDDLTQSEAESDGEFTSAVSALSEKGVTVAITYKPEDESSISTLSLEDNQYAIVYKEQELIIGPTQTRGTLISAAKDSTYKQFATREEAERFIKEKGLEYEANGASE